MNEEQVRERQYQLGMTPPKAEFPSEDTGESQQRHGNVDNFELFEREFRGLPSTGDWVASGYLIEDGLQGVYVRETPDAPQRCIGFVSSAKREQLSELAKKVWPIQGLASATLRAKLRAFRDAAFALGEAWDRGADSFRNQNLLTENYPFQDSFDEVVLGIEKWVDPYTALRDCEACKTETAEVGSPFCHVCGSLTPEERAATQPDIDAQLESEREFAEFDEQCAQEDAIADYLAENPEQSEPDANDPPFDLPLRIGDASEVNEVSHGETYVFDRYFHTVARFSTLEAATWFIERTASPTKDGVGA